MADLSNAFMHAVTWSSCMVVPASFHYRHVMRHSKHHRGMRVMVVVVILVRYGQRQEDHT